MLTFQNSDARNTIRKALGDEAAAEIAELDFLTFGDLDEEVRADVSWIKTRKVVPDGVIVVRGYVYEVETGKVRAVH